MILLGQVASGLAAGEGSMEALLMASTFTLNDYLAAYLAAAGVNSALLRRAREGGSYHVKTSLTGASVWVQMLGQLAPQYWHDGAEGVSKPPDPAPDELTTDEDAIWRHRASAADRAVFRDAGILGPAARTRRRVRAGVAHGVMPGGKRPDDDEFIKSLAKGLAVIESFGPDYPVMNLTTVARRNGLSPGSARRVLTTLTRLGFVWMKDQRFGLSARALRGWAIAYLSSQPIVNLIQPRLSALLGNRSTNPAR